MTETDPKHIDALAAEVVEEEPSEKELCQFMFDNFREPIEFICHTEEEAHVIIRNHIRFARAILAKWGRPAAPPAPETPAEALAARPLLEQVAQLGDCIGANTVSQIMAISGRAADWLKENPPGQPVAIEPRGCPLPGACSCVEPTPPAPEPGEVEELVAEIGVLPETELQEMLELNRAATLFQQLSAPAPVPAPVAPAAEHDPSNAAPLLWLLWNHLGSQSPVGQVIREYLRMGRFDRMTQEQIEAADHWSRENRRRLRQQPPAPQPEDPQP